MVYDIDKIESHPGKPLKIHINGIGSKVERRTKNFLAKYAALFHDFGKINPNFQLKLQGKKSVGYSQHSYISAFAFLNWYLANRNEANKAFEIEGNDLTKIKIITAIILHHHGHLPNMDENISTQAFDAMKEYLETNARMLPISEFLEKEMNFPHSSFDLSIKHWYNKQIPNIDIGGFEIDNWKKDALNYFIDTQFSFASVIESDKRDAGQNELFKYTDLLHDNVGKLNTSLKSLFLEYSKSNSVSELNNIRTEIRKEAVNSISKLLETEQRVFTLTAPTGAGKTFTLLDVAREIQQKKGNLGIIFALPFLSITDQVQDIITKTLGIEALSVNSKTFNERIEKAQKEYESNQTEENLKALLLEDFIEGTFDHPFIITTFIQLFETLLSNRNSTLLKLPNFSNRIFLIDEVQALPPRLYIFFSAWLDTFCKKYNSFAILSTATMPNLALPDKSTLKDNKNYTIRNPQLLFKNYETPRDLILAQKFFNNSVFNRYRVSVLKKDQTIISLAKKIIEEQKSILIILNTIQDTKDLYYQLKELPHVFLLNTHFTPEDRLLKIERVKELLPTQKVILISSQLIEAGVDIDFPIVYRDLCPLPSLIQSAGRCNRNKKLDFGNVFLFKLVKENGKASSELVYRNEAKLFLDFIKKNIKGTIEERELFEVQREFFNSIAKNLAIGDYPEEKLNLIEEINKAQFEKVGRFQLINNKIFGKQYQFFVPQNEDDENFETLLKLTKAISKESYEESQKSKIDINTQIKKMSNRIISVRIFNSINIPPLSHPEAVCGLNKLSPKYYSFKEGIELNMTENCIL